MKLVVGFRAEAAAEFESAVDYYETRRPGLGRRFAEEVQRVLDRIAEFPTIHPVVTHDVRMGMTRRFPYCVLYRTRSRSLEVLAVFHSSRDPSEWRRRIGDEPDSDLA